MIGPFLVLIGLLLVWTAVRGKSKNLLDAIGLKDVGNEIKKNAGEWAKNNIWDPVSKALTINIKLPGQ